MKLTDIYETIEYAPPLGGIDVSCNVDLILTNIYKKGFDGEIELTKKEFSSVFMALKEEILVSMLLGCKTMNQYFKDGIEIRGFLIKIKEDEQ